MYINNYFNTTIWSEQKPEFVKSLNKASNKYIKEARKRNKIIRERERNLSYCWNAFHSKTSKWTSLFFSDHDKFADPRSSS